MQNEQNQEPTVPENSGVDAVARHNARRYALQAMYQWQIAGTPMPTIETEFVNFQIDRKIDLDYFKKLIHGVPEKHLDIDDEMRPFLSRGVHEIDPIELGVLRLAVFELLHCPEVPYRVIINEALELTKKFGSVEGYKFVNGLLDKIAKKHRQIER
jgi:N utilization substance protein B